MIGFIPHVIPCFLRRSPLVKSCRHQGQIATLQAPEPQGDAGDVDEESARCHQPWVFHHVNW